MDGAGNVYVTGYSYGSGTATDYATVKYDAAGNQLWAARYNGPGNSDDQAAALAVDGAGNVYVTGRSLGSGTGYDYATIKYDVAGNQLWVARYNGPGNGDDFPRVEPSLGEYGLIKFFLLCFQEFVVVGGEDTLQPRRLNMIP